MLDNQRVEAFSQVLERIYASAVDDSDFEPALPSIRLFLGIGCASILTIRAEQIVSDCGSATSTLVPEGTPAPRETEPSTVLTHLQELREGIFRICVHVPVGDDLYCRIRLQNASGTGDLTPEQVRKLDLIGRHLEIAVRTRESLRVMERRQRSAETLLRRWRVGLVRCDRDGWVHDIQGGAEALLRRFSRFVYIQNGRLRAAGQGAEARLMKLLADPSHGQSYAGPTLSLTAGPANEALECTVVAQNDRDSAERLPGERMVVLREGGDTDAVDPHYLRRCLGLTRSEADVLGRLMLGANVETIAEARGSTLGTIRFYLKELRRKLACRNQGQLVAVGWKAIGFAPSSVGR